MGFECDEQKVFPGIQASEDLDGRNFERMYYSFCQYDLGSYRIDPNHDVQPLMSDPGFASYLQEYNYEMNAANIASSAWHPTEISVDNVEYCLENTQTADHNVWAYTTQVLFKVIYSPKGLIDPDKNVYNNPADK